MSREEAECAVRVAQTELRTERDSLAALQRSSEATAGELATAQSALKQGQEESRELRDSLEKMREELTAVYARAHSAEVCLNGLHSISIHRMASYSMSSCAWNMGPWHYIEAS